MKYLLASFCVSLSPPAFADCAILVHGLARSEASFTLMEAALEAEDYTIVRPGYPSTKAEIPELANSVIPKAIAQCPAGPVHFVTHSMGGILVRSWLATNRPNGTHPLGRVVMLAPPNKGSEVVDKFANLYLFGLLNGPAADQLVTAKGGFVDQLPAVDYPVGVIAGNQSLNPYFSTLLPGPDDGKVSVKATFVKGMSGHITLPVTHTFMMNNPRVISEVVVFLKTGKFDHDISWGDAMLDRLGCEDANCLRLDHDEKDGTAQADAHDP